MSIVVSVSRGSRTVMAADSLVFFGDSVRMPPSIGRASKVMRLGSSIVGGTGWAIYDDILRDFLGGQPTPAFDSAGSIFAFFMELWRALHDRYPFVNDQAAGKDTPFGDLDATFLIANTTGMYKVSSDMGVTRLDRYVAIGSGSDYALGALHALDGAIDDPAELARRAVAAAIEFDVYCGGEVDVLEVG